MCANDQMAIGVVRTLTARGIRIPEEVAVVGFDDIFPASLTDPPLTTVHQPMRKIGERGCDRLIERITDPTLRPAGRTAPGRTGAAVKLRLPAGYGDAAARDHHHAPEGGPVSETLRFPRRTTRWFTGPTPRPWLTTEMTER